jgi:hypothetical protein
MENKKESKERVDKKKKEEEEPLPFCTTAPSAEHSRGDLDEEPCDDFREGD